MARPSTALVFQKKGPPGTRPDGPVNPGGEGETPGFNANDLEAQRLKPPSHSLDLLEEIIRVALARSNPGPQAREGRYRYVAKPRP